jgi:hypothetical protein
MTELVPVTISTERVPALALYAGTILGTAAGAAAAYETRKKGCDWSLMVAAGLGAFALGYFFVILPLQKGTRQTIITPDPTGWFKLPLELGK